ncbi:MAG: hypothetical protein HUU34_12945 [Saprospiraceae bacterium]|jgi:hypothetical protein|nr:hypothetical protein [Saprospiraceae bacterium]
MSELEIQQSIIKAMNRMSLVQQIKLLEFVNSMLAAPVSKKPKGILKFSGVFDDTTAREFADSLKDCEQIDENEW